MFPSTSTGFNLIVWEIVRERIPAKIFAGKTRYLKIDYQADNWGRVESQNQLLTGRSDQTGPERYSF